MKSENEIELHRLADMLHKIDESLERTSPLREALQKAGISLALGFMHGMRPEIESHYQQLGTPLSEAERAHLRSLGIGPDASNDETLSAGNSAQILIMSQLATYLKHHLPNGMPYRDAATLCIRLFGNVSGVPENLYPLTKEVIADAFAELAKNGWITEFNKHLPYTPSSCHHEVTDRGHWIEVIMSVLSKNGLERFDGLRGEELARLVGFTTKNRP